MLPNNAKRVSFDSISIDAITDRIAELQTEIKDLEAKIDSQFAELTKIRYHLHSVFMHRGGPSSGHYWVYIFDFEQDIWRRYNDGYVTEVDDDQEIYGKDALESRPATPYFLVYIRGNLEIELTNAVCRHPTEPPPPYSEDTMMDDAPPSVQYEQANEPKGPVGGWDARESTALVAW